MSIPQSGGGPIASYDQMVAYLESGCKPKQDWRIGTEHEKFGYCKDKLLPLPYDGERSIRVMLEGLRDAFEVKLYTRTQYLDAHRSRFPFATVGFFDGAIHLVTVSRIETVEAGVVDPLE